MSAPHPRPTPAPTLRAATGDDAEAVADVWHRGWHLAHAGHVPDGLTARRTREAFGERASQRLADTTVAELAGRVAGFVMVVDDEAEQVYVEPDLRGTGIGTVLLAEAERQIARAGHDLAWLAVVAGNAPARRFYERHGWRDAGDLPYEVVALGERFVSPCRRYEKTLSTAGTSAPAAEPSPGR